MIPSHVVAIVTASSFDAVDCCEYFVHVMRAVIHSLCTLGLTAERHFCSNFEHEVSGRADEETRYLSV
jgi:hypothetical protein